VINAAMVPVAYGKILALKLRLKSNLSTAAPRMAGIERRKENVAATSC
jgi:hypothetical protein